MNTLMKRRTLCRLCEVGVLVRLLNTGFQKTEEMDDFASRVRKAWRPA